jgi:DNA-binding transcriptional ArsR family regulator
MVKQSRGRAGRASPAEVRLDEVFSALADPTRRAIVARLSAGETSVGELAEPFDISLPAVSKHLKVLEGAGLLARKRDGRVHHCRLVADPLAEAIDWIVRYGRFWDAQLDSLETFLVAERSEQSGRGPPDEGKP